MNEQLKASIDDPEFSRLLEESQTYYDDAKSFYTWDPDDGQTTCVLVEVTHEKVMNKQLNKEIVVVRAKVEIQDGDDAGQVFDLAGSWGWSGKMMSGLKTLASLLSGKPVTDLVESIAILYDNLGAGMLVSTTRTPRKGGGEPYVNHRVLNRIDVEAPATA